MIIDMNVSLGNWPFQEFAINTPKQLSEHLKKSGIDIAYVRSCQAALLPDPEADNHRLITLLAPYKQLIPVPTINPHLTGWENMADFSTIKAVNIYPSYHSYKLDSSPVAEFAEKCIATDTSLFITMRIEDIRGANPHCIVQDVPATEINQLACNFPTLKIICLNSSIAEVATLTKKAPNLYLDIAYCECGDSMHNLNAKIAPSQIVFGSHTPFFCTRSEIMKVEYSDIADKTKRAIFNFNITTIFLLEADMESRDLPKIGDEPFLPNP